MTKDWNSRIQMQYGKLMVGLEREEAREGHGAVYIRKVVINPCRCFFTLTD